jgi:hypothetical protein
MILLKPAGRGQGIAPVQQLPVSATIIWENGPRSVFFDLKTGVSKERVWATLSNIGTGQKLDHYNWLPLVHGDSNESTVKINVGLPISDDEETKEKADKPSSGRTPYQITEAGRYRIVFAKVAAGEVGEQLGGAEFEVGEVAKLDSVTITSLSLPGSK